MQITNKLPNIGTSIFTVMSQLAIQYNAVNLGQGFPDFMMSEELIEFVNKAMKDGNNQYTHTNGLPNLREAIAEKCSFLYQSNINPETEITITPGGTYALYTALTTLLQKDDEVIVFEPCYDCYIPAIELNGAKAVLIELEYPNYSINWQEVKAKITPKTKAILINSPHNPTGSVLSVQDIAALRLVVANTNIIIISDEVYEHLIFDNLQHQSILKYPDLLERSIVCFSLGKTYHCTGWKLGYAIAPANIMSAFRTIHQFNCFSCFTPTQVALATYIKNKEAYLNLGAVLQQKRDYFRTLMQQTAFELIPSYGSYFECYSYAKISDQSDTKLAEYLTKHHGIATIPVSAFYKKQTDNKVLRFCFAKKEETLNKAVEKLFHFKG